VSTARRPPEVAADAPTVVPLPRPDVPVVDVQGMLALDFGPRQDPPRRPDGRADVVAIDRIAPGRRHELEAWASRFGQAVVEIVGGDRPVSQLLRWCSAAVYDDLARRARLVALAGQHRAGVARVQPVRPKVVGVRSCFLSPDVVEASLHLRYGRRSRALAARFEWVRERWLCTALEYA